MQASMSEIVQFLEGRDDCVHQSTENHELIEPRSPTGVEDSRAISKQLDDSNKLPPPSVIDELLFGFLGLSEAEQNSAAPSLCKARDVVPPGPSPLKPSEPIDGSTENYGGNWVEGFLEEYDYSCPSYAHEEVVTTGTQSPRPGDKEPPERLVASSNEYSLDVLTQEKIDVQSFQVEESSHMVSAPSVIDTEEESTFFEDMGFDMRNTAELKDCKSYYETSSSEITTEGPSEDVSPACGNLHIVPMSDGIMEVTPSPPEEFAVPLRKIGNLDVGKGSPHDVARVPIAIVTGQSASSLIRPISLVVKNQIVLPFSGDTILSESDSLDSLDSGMPELVRADDPPPPVANHVYDSPPELEPVGQSSGVTSKKGCKTTTFTLASAAGEELSNANKKMSLGVVPESIQESTSPDELNDSLGKIVPSFTSDMSKQMPALMNAIYDVGNISLKPSNNVPLSKVGDGGSLPLLPITEEPRAYKTFEKTPTKRPIVSLPKKTKSPDVKTKDSCGVDKGFVRDLLRSVNGGPNRLSGPNCVVEFRNKVPVKPAIRKNGSAEVPRIQENSVDLKNNNGNLFNSSTDSSHKIVNSVPVQPTVSSKGFDSLPDLPLNIHDVRDLRAEKAQSSRSAKDNNSGIHISTKEVSSLEHDLVVRGKHSPDQPNKVRAAKTTCKSMLTPSTPPKKTTTIIANVVHNVSPRDKMPEITEVKPTPSKSHEKSHLSIPEKVLTPPQELKVSLPISSLDLLSVRIIGVNSSEKAHVMSSISTPTMAQRKQYVDVVDSSLLPPFNSNENISPSMNSSAKQTTVKLTEILVDQDVNSGKKSVVNATNSSQSKICSRSTDVAVNNGQTSLKGPTPNSSPNPLPRQHEASVETSMQKQISADQKTGKKTSRKSNITKSDDVNVESTRPVDQQDVLKEHPVITIVNSLIQSASKPSTVFEDPKKDLEHTTVSSVSGDSTNTKSSTDCVVADKPKPPEEILKKLEGKANNNTLGKKPIRRSSVNITEGSKKINPIAVQSGDKTAVIPSIPEMAVGPSVSEPGLNAAVEGLNERKLPLLEMKNSPKLTDKHGLIPPAERRKTRSSSCSTKTPNPSLDDLNNEKSDVKVSIANTNDEVSIKSDAAAANLKTASPSSTLVQTKVTKIPNPNASKKIVGAPKAAKPETEKVVATKEATRNEAKSSQSSKNDTLKSSHPVDKKPLQKEPFKNVTGSKIVVAKAVMEASKSAAQQAKKTNTVEKSQSILSKPEVLADKICPMIDEELNSDVKSVDVESKIETGTTSLCPIVSPKPIDKCSPTANDKNHHVLENLKTQCAEVSNIKAAVDKPGTGVDIAFNQYNLKAKPKENSYNTDISKLQCVGETSGNKAKSPALETVQGSADNLHEHRETFREVSFGANVEHFQQFKEKKELPIEIEHVTDEQLKDELLLVQKAFERNLKNNSVSASEVCCKETIVQDGIETYEEHSSNPHQHILQGGGKEAISEELCIQPVQETSKVELTTGVSSLSVNREALVCLPEQDFKLHTTSRKDSPKNLKERKVTQSKDEGAKLKIKSSKLKAGGEDKEAISEKQCIQPVQETNKVELTTGVSSLSVNREALVCLPEQDFKLDTTFGKDSQKNLKERKVTQSKDEGAKLKIKSSKLKAGGEDKEAISEKQCIQPVQETNKVELTTGVSSLSVNREALVCLPEQDFKLDTTSGKDSQKNLKERKVTQSKDEGAKLKIKSSKLEAGGEDKEAISEEQCIQPVQENSKVELTTGVSSLSVIREAVCLPEQDFKLHTTQSKDEGAKLKIKPSKLKAGGLRSSGLEGVLLKLREKVEDTAIKKSADRVADVQNKNSSESENKTLETKDPLGEVIDKIGPSQKTVSVEDDKKDSLLQSKEVIEKTESALPVLNRNKKSASLEKLVPKLKNVISNCKSSIDSVKSSDEAKLRKSKSSDLLIGVVKDRTTLMVQEAHKISETAAFKRDTSKCKVKKPSLGHWRIVKQDKELNDDTGLLGTDLKMSEVLQKSESKTQLRSKNDAPVKEGVAAPSGVKSIEHAVEKDVKQTKTTEDTSTQEKKSMRLRTRSETSNDRKMRDEEPPPSVGNDKQMTPVLPRQAKSFNKNDLKQAEERSTDCADSNKSSVKSSKQKLDSADEKLLTDEFQDKTQQTKSTAKQPLKNILKGSPETEVGSDMPVAASRRAENTVNKEIHIIGNAAGVSSNDQIDKEPKLRPRTRSETSNEKKVDKEEVGNSELPSKRAACPKKSRQPRIDSLEKKAVSGETSPCTGNQPSKSSLIANVDGNTLVSDVYDFTEDEVQSNIHTFNQFRNVSGKSIKNKKSISATTESTVPHIDNELNTSTRKSRSEKADGHNSRKSSPKKATVKKDASVPEKNSKEKIAIDRKCLTADSSVLSAEVKEKAATGSKTKEMASEEVAVGTNRVLRSTSKQNPNISSVIDSEIDLKEDQQSLSEQCREGTQVKTNLKVLDNKVEHSKGKRDCTVVPKNNQQNVISVAVDDDSLKKRKTRLLNKRTPKNANSSSQKANNSSKDDLLPKLRSSVSKKVNETPPTEGNESLLVEANLKSFKLANSPDDEDSLSDSMSLKSEILGDELKLTIKRVKKPMQTEKANSSITVETQAKKSNKETPITNCASKDKIKPGKNTSFVDVAEVLSSQSTILSVQDPAVCFAEAVSLKTPLMGSVVTPEPDNIQAVNDAQHREPEGAKSSTETADCTPVTFQEEKGRNERKRVVRERLGKNQNNLEDLKDNSKAVVPPLVDVMKQSLRECSSSWDCSLPNEENVATHYKRVTRSSLVEVPDSVVHPTIADTGKGSSKLDKQTSSILEPNATQYNCNSPELSLTKNKKVVKGEKQLGKRLKTEPESTVTIDKVPVDAKLRKIEKSVKLKSVEHMSPIGASPKTLKGLAGCNGVVLLSKGVDNEPEISKCEEKRKNGIDANIPDSPKCLTLLPPVVVPVETVSVSEVHQIPVKTSSSRRKSKVAPPSKKVPVNSTVGLIVTKSKSSVKEVCLASKSLDKILSEEDIKEMPTSFDVQSPGKSPDSTTRADIDISKLVHDPLIVNSRKISEDSQGVTSTTEIEHSPIVEESTSSDISEVIILAGQVKKGDENVTSTTDSKLNTIPYSDLKYDGITKEINVKITHPPKKQPFNKRTVNCRQPSPAKDDIACKEDEPKVENLGDVEENTSECNVLHPRKKIWKKADLSKLFADNVVKVQSTSPENETSEQKTMRDEKFKRSPLKKRQDWRMHLNDEEDHAIETSVNEEKKEIPDYSPIFNSHSIYNILSVGPSDANNQNVQTPDSISGSLEGSQSIRKRRYVHKGNPKLLRNMKVNSYLPNNIALRRGTRRSRVLFKAKLFSGLSKKLTKVKVKRLSNTLKSTKTVIKTTQKPCSSNVKKPSNSLDLLASDGCSRIQETCVEPVKCLIDVDKTANVKEKDLVEPNQCKSSLREEVPGATEQSVLPLVINSTDSTIDPWVQEEDSPCFSPHLPSKQEEPSDEELPNPVPAQPSPVNCSGFTPVVSQWTNQRIPTSLIITPPSPTIAPWPIMERSRSFSSPSHSSRTRARSESYPTLSSSVPSQIPVDLSFRRQSCSKTICNINTDMMNIGKMDIYGENPTFSTPLRDDLKYDLAHNQVRFMKPAAASWSRSMESMSPINVPVPLPDQTLTPIHPIPLSTTSEMLATISPYPSLSSSQVKDLLPVAFNDHTLYQQRLSAFRSSNNCPGAHFMAPSVSGLHIPSKAKRTSKHKAKRNSSRSTSFKPNLTPEKRSINTTSQPPLFNQHEISCLSCSPANNNYNIGFAAKPNPLLLTPVLIPAAVKSVASANYNYENDINNDITKIERKQALQKVVREFNDGMNSIKDSNPKSISREGRNLIDGSTGRSNVHSTNKTTKCKEYLPISNKIIKICIDKKCDSEKKKKIPGVSLFDNSGKVSSECVPEQSNSNTSPELAKKSKGLPKRLLKESTIVLDEVSPKSVSLGPQTESSICCNEASNQDQSKISETCVIVNEISHVTRSSGQFSSSESKTSGSHINTVAVSKDAFIPVPSFIPVQTMSLATSIVDQVASNSKAPEVETPYSGSLTSLNPVSSALSHHGTANTSNKSSTLVNAEQSTVPCPVSSDSSNQGTANTSNKSSTLVNAEQSTIASPVSSALSHHGTANTSNKSSTLVNAEQSTIASSVSSALSHHGTANTSNKSSTLVNAEQSTIASPVSSALSHHGTANTSNKSSTLVNAEQSIIASPVSSALSHHGTANTSNKSSTLVNAEQSPISPSTFELEPEVPNNTSTSSEPTHSIIMSENIGDQVDICDVTSNEPCNPLIPVQGTPKTLNSKTDGKPLETCATATIGSSAIQYISSATSSSLKTTNDQIAKLADGDKSVDRSDIKQDREENLVATNVKPNVGNDSSSESLISGELELSSQKASLEVNPVKTKLIKKYPEKVIDRSNVDLEIQSMENCEPLEPRSETSCIQVDEIKADNISKNQETDISVQTTDGTNLKTPDSPKSPLSQTLTKSHPSESKICSSDTKETSVLVTISEPNPLTPQEQVSELSVPHQDDEIPNSAATVTESSLPQSQGTEVLTESKKLNQTIDVESKALLNCVSLSESKETLILVSDLQSKKDGEVLNGALETTSEDNITLLDNLDSKSNSNQSNPTEQCGLSKTADTSHKLPKLQILPCTPIETTTSSSEETKVEPENTSINNLEPIADLKSTNNCIELATGEVEVERNSEDNSDVVSNVSNTPSFHHTPSSVVNEYHKDLNDFVSTFDTPLPSPSSSSEPVSQLVQPTGNCSPTNSSEVPVISPLGCIMGTDESTKGPNQEAEGSDAGVFAGKFVLSNGRKRKLPEDSEDEVPSCKSVDSSVRQTKKCKETTVKVEIRPISPNAMREIMRSGLKINATDWQEILKCWQEYNRSFGAPSLRRRVESAGFTANSSGMARREVKEEPKTPKSYVERGSRPSTSHGPTTPMPLNRYLLEREIIRHTLQRNKSQKRVSETFIEGLRIHKREIIPGNKKFDVFSSGRHSIQNVSSPAVQPVVARSYSQILEYLRETRRMAETESLPVPTCKDFINRISKDAVPGCQTNSVDSLSLPTPLRSQGGDVNTPLTHLPKASSRITIISSESDGEHDSSNNGEHVMKGRVEVRKRSRRKDNSSIKVCSCPSASLNQTLKVCPTCSNERNRAQGAYSSIPSSTTAFYAEVSNMQRRESERIMKSTAVGGGEDNVIADDSLRVQLLKVLASLAERRPNSTTPSAATYSRSLTCDNPIPTSFTEDLPPPYEKERVTTRDVPALQLDDESLPRVPDDSRGPARCSNRKSSCEDAPFLVEGNNSSNLQLQKESLRKSHQTPCSSSSDEPSRPPENVDGRLFESHTGGGSHAPSTSKSNTAEEASRILTRIGSLIPPDLVDEMFKILPESKQLFRSSADPSEEPPKKKRREQ